MGKTIELTAADGHKLSAYKAEPAGKPRGALIVIMEIFALTDWIRGVTDSRKDAPVGRLRSHTESMNTVGTRLQQATGKQG